MSRPSRALGELLVGLKGRGLMKYFEGGDHIRQNATGCQ
jgi:hypothetical protein